MERMPPDPREHSHRVHATRPTGTQADIYSTIAIAACNTMCVYACFALQSYET